MQVCEFGLEFDVIVRRAGNVARAAGARTDEINRLVHRREHLGVLGHAEIVVGAPDSDFAGSAARKMARFRERSAVTLDVRKNAIATLTPHCLQSGTQIRLVIHPDTVPRAVSRTFY